MNKLPSIIGDDEFLYRGVDAGGSWDFVNDRPSSAAFKDNNGASVDRSGGRNNELCIEGVLKIKLWKGILKILSSKAKDLGAIIKYLPIENENIFHCEIYESDKDKKVRKPISKMLRDESELVYKRD